MNKVPEFLKGIKENITDDALGKLKTYVAFYKSYEIQIEKLEEELKQKKKLLNDYSQNLIPELLNSFGLSEIKLNTGEKVIVKEDISVTIENNEKFFEFLKSRDEDDIIKLAFFFPKMESEKVEALYNYLVEQNYEYESEKSVHAQTRKKYFKELLGIGKPDLEQGLKSGKYIIKEIIENFVKIFTYHTTKIK